MYPVHSDLFGPRIVAPDGLIPAGLVIAAIAAAFLAWWADRAMGRAVEMSEDTRRQILTLIFVVALPLAMFLFLATACG